MDVLVTDRLALRIPSQADRRDVFALYTDPRVWAADPVTRHVTDAQTEQQIDRWRAGWDANGLGMWIARDRSGEIVGVGGCFIRGAVAWNLGFRIMPQHWGQGYAQEISRSAIESARSKRPDLPMTGYVLDGNTRSRRTLAAVGLAERWRGPDAGNPDLSAVRVLFADRPLPDSVVVALTET